MSLEHQFACPLPNGLHARPASHLQAIVSRFSSSIKLVNLRSGAEANAKSVLALIGADVHHGDPCVLRVAGSDEAEALSVLADFLRDEFVHCDEVLPETKAAAANLPRALKAIGVTHWQGGIVACRGLAQAPVVRIGDLAVNPEISAARPEGVVVEQKKLQAALANLTGVLGREIAECADKTSREVLAAHRAFLQDVALTEKVEGLIATGRCTAGQAIIAAVAEFTATLRVAKSAYLRERVLDFQDVAARLLTQLYGATAVARVPVLTSPAIVVAEALTPGQFLALDRRFLRGLVLAQDGATSHTVILARSFNVPTLCGVGVPHDLAPDQEIILDGFRGGVLVQITEAVSRFYAQERQWQTRAAERMAVLSCQPGKSIDGESLPLLANVSSAEEVGAAIAAGAEGIGLFRTEMLFMDRRTAPTEEEQSTVYGAAIRSAEGRPVTIRTIDIGGDKPLPYLQLPPEQNPFLGYRGVRLYEEFSQLIRTQLRAILRASAHGPVKIMVPMVAALEEMRAFRALVREVQLELRAAGLHDGHDVTVGMMIEVPSAVFALRELAEEADFFSLGTNDLTQYFFAADRNDARVSAHDSWKQPAFLRLLQQAVNTAHEVSRPIGLCGELAGVVEALPLLLGLSLDSLSLSSPRIAEIKTNIAQWDSRAAAGVLANCLAAVDRSGVTTALLAARDVRPQPLTEPALIVLDSGATSKAEVINELVHRLSLEGRVDDRVLVEEAIWAREETYSTGFGGGFAMPHGKSPHVRVNSLALVRLAEPVEWGAQDGAPVRVVLLLAIREADQGKEHLRIFARLSRLIMREEFRAQIERAPDANTLCGLLSEQLLA